jgi:hypothetical protein
MAEAQEETAMRTAITLIALVAASAVHAAPADDVARLSWMAGTWTQEKDGATVRETWLAPVGGAMGGAGQTNAPGKKPFVESMKITAEPAGATFTYLPPGQAPVPFLLISSKDGEATFENKANDFPQRVTYRRCGADLCARIEGTVQGKLQFEEWRYTRAR